MQTQRGKHEGAKFAVSPTQSNCCGSSDSMYFREIGRERSCWFWWGNKSSTQGSWDILRDVDRDVGLFVDGLSKNADLKVDDYCCG